MDEGIVDVKARFEELAPAAIDKLASLMGTSKDEKIQRLCAADILRMAGHGNTSTRIEIGDKTVVNMPESTVNVLLSALRESHTPAPAPETMDAESATSSTQSESGLVHIN